MTTHLMRVTFRGYTWGGPAADVGITELTGWLGTPGALTGGEGGGSQHGRPPRPIPQGVRTVIVDGLIRDVTRRDPVLNTLERLYSVGQVDDYEPERLEVEIGGQVRYAGAQLVDWQPNTSRRLWVAGFTAVRLILECADPRVFGERITATSALTPPAAGAPIPSDIPFDLPAEPLGGTVHIDNPGTARSGSNVTVTLRGEQTGTVGVLHVNTGATQFYDFELEQADRLVFSTEEGTTLNDAPRQAVHPSRAAVKLRALPGVVNTYQALGQAGAGAPDITVDLDPAYL